MNDSLKKLAHEWVRNASQDVNVENEYYCATRDIFQARFDKLTRELFSKKNIEGDPYIVVAIAGEIGNNSFDHNIGNWRDIPGIFFGYSFLNNAVTIVIADRGRGVMETLKKVKPGLANDRDALMVAFTERISGRAPEARGNGLKFVRENIKNKKMHLNFFSGQAEAELNKKMIIKKTEDDILGCLAIIRV